MSEPSTTPERYEELAQYVLDPNHIYRSDISPVEVATALRELAEMKRAIDSAMRVLDAEIATSGLFARHALRNVRRELCDVAGKSGDVS